MNDTGYRPPQVRITATYPATDGTAPEMVTVEIDGVDHLAEFAREMVAAVVEVARDQPIAYRVADEYVLHRD